ncbi:MAG: ThuA domain-containing protein [Fuerstiella sp.]|nr:ThuA domain-containing protein [Fuerstiella sp.]
MFRISSTRFFSVFILVCAATVNIFAQDADQPHAVFVVGTQHYAPGDTLPALATQLERMGFRTTVVRPPGNPEKNSAGTPGLGALRTADVAIFYMRFLTLPNDQLKLIVDYLESGKPVVGFRCSTHAFAYPDDSPNAKWNDGFGRDALGSRYFVHLQGTTRVNAVAIARRHPILTGVKLNNDLVAAGTLYLADPPEDAEVLLGGTGSSKKTGKVTNAFGTHLLTETMTQPVAWTWNNKWGGRVFTTTLGHPGTFRNRSFVRLFLNGICWAAGKDVPQKVRVRPIGSGGRPDPKANVANPSIANMKDARNANTGKAAPPEDAEYLKYGIYAKTAPHAQETKPRTTTLPLDISKGDRIALVGNTLIDRSQLSGYFETMLHQRFPEHGLVIRNLAWPADTPDLQPRPDNFADQDQHLTHEQVDVIFAGYGFNESFAGEDGIPAFRHSLAKYLKSLKSKAYNGESAPKIVLISPIASENIQGVAAGSLNNHRIQMYVDAMRDIAAEQGVAFANVFDDTLRAMKPSQTDLTLNGVHLLDSGYEVFARSLYRNTFGEDASAINEGLRANIIDKNRQYFRRYRPLNTFYYTGGRNKTYGYLDFLPAMKNFDIMTANRDARSWDLARGRTTSEQADDSNLPILPDTKESRGANNWTSAEDELKAFEIDSRFEVNLFAGEEEFPDIAAPIQMRWDSLGRLWVSCSTTYPHVYPGKEPDDKLVILEDTDGDGKADKSTVFADDLHIPLSFELGNGGVYVSEEPHLTFLKDTDGDGRADFRQQLLTGFGTEDSHHALHDFVWTPDGDLVFRESIFHHSQVETPYGPVRQQNSGWFRFDHSSHRLSSFGTYHSTNPWGVTFDDWGQHMASHPVYAAAFHSLDPPFPQQHPKPAGLQAYSGTCGQELVDFETFPDELKGHFIKARYKPTNRIEILKWKEGPFGFEEEYVSDLIFSKNLSFIPVDLRYGPRGAMYVCDWYNPVKGHAQYSLRDERRDRHSGRIWRITAKGKPLLPLPKITDTSVEDLLQILKRPEYRIRYIAKRELRSRNAKKVAAALDVWVQNLDPGHPRYRHHQVEAIWAYRNIGANGRTSLQPSPDPESGPQKQVASTVAVNLLREVLQCDEHLARAAAVEQLRYWHMELPDAYELLNGAANDVNGIVRMQAAICGSYLGTPEALDIVIQTLNHPAEKHVAYAIQCSLGSHTLRRHWEGNPKYNIGRILNRLARSSELKEPTPSAGQAEFDSQKNLKTVRISCLPERMLYTVNQFAVTTGQPVKIMFTNPDATDHNLVIVKPNALAEVGMAANAMARDPKNANSDFIPDGKKDLILQASPMIGPTRKSQVHVMRFEAPTEAGIYPFVCTFPGHWIIMKGEIVVADDLSEVNSMLAARKPDKVNDWKVADFPEVIVRDDEATMMKGMQAFVKARCNQCHVVAGHGINLGPELTDVAKRFKGKKLLQQILDPSSEINRKYQNHQFVLKSGKVISGVIVEESPAALKVVSNLLSPNSFTRITKNEVEEQIPSTISAMPNGLANVLTKAEILDMVSFLEYGGYKLPEHLQHNHKHTESIK